jgi:mono/diheme cytochrome c family protein
LTSALLCSALIVASGQQFNGIFTSEQAAAGRVAYEKTCGRCHTLTLLGRQGKPEERPPVSSLSAADQQFIGNYGGRVPPLAGEAFL